jgi:hypothetical protein
MPHLPPAHHETSNRDSPNETKVKEKQNKTIPDSNSNLAKSMTHHNQTKKRTTWFLTMQCQGGPTEPFDASYGVQGPLSPAQGQCQPAMGLTRRGA